MKKKVTFKQILAAVGLLLLLGMYVVSIVFACLANTIVCEKQPSLIVIEGGATAFAVIGRLGWTSFSVKRELSPGVVCLSYGDTDIILKPGSYDWGNLFC